MKIIVHNADKDMTLQIAEYIKHATSNKTDVWMVMDSGSDFVIYSERSGRFNIVSHKRLVGCLIHPNKGWRLVNRCKKLYYTADAWERHTNNGAQFMYVEWSHVANRVDTIELIKPFFPFNERDSSDMIGYIKPAFAADIANYGIKNKVASKEDAVNNYLRECLVSIYSNILQEARHEIENNNIKSGNAPTNLERYVDQFMDKTNLFVTSLQDERRARKIVHEELGTYLSKLSHLFVDLMYGD